MNAILTQFLIDIVRGARKAEFAADPEAVICGSALDGLDVFRSLDWLVKRALLCLPG
jgi:hypothetical protein